MEVAKPAGKRQRTKYDAAFRTEAVRRVNQDGQAATRVAQALGISEAVLGEHQKVWGSWGQQLLRLTWEAIVVGEDHDPINPCFNC